MRRKKIFAGVDELNWIMTRHLTVEKQSRTHRVNEDFYVATGKIVLPIFTLAHSSLVTHTVE